MKKKETINSIRLINGHGKNDHRFISFKVTLILNTELDIDKGGNGKIVLTKKKNLIIDEDPSASIDDNGRIILKTGHNILNLSFDPVSNVVGIKIDVLQTDNANGNLVLNEIKIYSTIQNGRL